MESNRRIILIIPLIIYLSFSTFGYAYAIDNNCKITPIHILELRIIFSCIEERLDALENASSGDLTTASNLGNTGEGVFSSEVGNDLQFKKLLSTNANLLITSNSTNVLFNATAGGGSESTVCGNVGSGNPLHKSGTNCDAFSLIAGNGITITNTTDDYTISSPTQIQADLFQTTSMTNIGTTYVDIYGGAFGTFHEDMITVNCDGVSQFTGVLFWDYVGTGTQSARLVTVIDNNNVLFEKTNITADFASGWVNSGDTWINKPAWCTSGFFSMEMQGKSTVAGDDPIPKGYIIWTR